MDFTPLDQHQVLLFLVQLLLLVGLARLLGGLMRWIGQPRWWESSWRGCCSAHPGGRSSRAHRPEGEGLVVEERHLEEATHAASNVVASAVELGQRLGVAVDPMIRLAPHPEQEIIELANGGQFDLLVLGTSTRR
ncbi:MAG: hypothetical protein ACRDXD_05380 [Acidimicrobiia bacterium]